MKINEQLDIISKINAIINSNPEGYNPRFTLEIWSLCDELEKLSTGPLLSEIERLEDIIRQHNRKPIPNLNDLAKYYESRN